MSTKTSKIFLLFLILSLAFAYRFFLMTLNTFPPGADIGLHESVIKSITAEGQTSFSWNYYHMGGGVSATNPGYHIFVATIIALTSAPDYLAHSIVASFLSALIVLCAFLLVRRLWSESASYIAAFLVAFSSGDIAIMIWGGYPNVATLMLIPIVFYMYLQRQKFSLGTYLVVASLLVGTMFLTHVFSTFVFTAITLLTLLVSAVFHRKTGITKTDVVSWLLPIILGVLLISPYLLQNLPVYFGPEGAITDQESAMKQALLETRLIPLNVVFLSLIPTVLFFLLSRLYKGKFVTVQSVLSAVWIMVPALMTQSYLVGVYLDYERFLYFLYLPIMICAALLIEAGAHLFSRIIHRLHNRIKKRKFDVSVEHPLMNKITSAFFILVLLLLSVFWIPIFTPPEAGIAEVDSFQTMTHPGYEAIQWIKTNTPAGSVCVADANYGWWLSGFGQRPTLSAVDPQYLILAHEFEPAKAAANLLETDYFLDNGLVRITQNGPSLGNGQEFSGWLNDSYVPYRFLSLLNDEVSVVYRENNTPQHSSLAQSSKTDMRVVNDLNYASFRITGQAQFFNFTEEITTFRGARFAKVSITLQAITEGVRFDWLHLPYQQRGVPTPNANTVVTVDRSMRVFSQIIFPEGTLGNDILLRENPDAYELVYSLEGKPSAQAQFYMGLTQYQPSQADELQDLITGNIETYLHRISDAPIDFFDYKATIEEWNISYIIIRNADSIPRLAKDPFFNLVFKNSEVAVFEVKRDSK